MSDDPKKDEPRYPSHGWGGLARDPWIPIGPRTEAARQVLKRYWKRNGGDDETFDRLIPPYGDAPEPPKR